MKDMKRKRKVYIQEKTQTKGIFSSSVAKPGPPYGRFTEFLDKLERRFQDRSENPADAHPCVFPPDLPWGASSALHTHRLSWNNNLLYVDLSSCGYCQWWVLGRFFGPEPLDLLLFKK